MNNPKGIPKIWLAAKAICTELMALPRWFGANRSEIIVMVSELVTPPKIPVKILAANNVVKEFDSAQNKVPMIKPVKKKSRIFFLSYKSINPAEIIPDVAALKI